MSSSSMDVPQPDNTTLQHPVAAITEVAQAAPALAALDAARAAVLDWQHGVASRLAAAQTEIVDMQKALEVTRAELAHVKQERDEWREECGQHKGSVSELRDSLAEQQKQVAAQQAQLQEHQAEIEGHKTQLEAQGEYSRKLQAELLELYRDLRAEDVPTLILRVGMRLTGAENSLFVNANGNEALASFGLEDLPDVVKQGLYDYAREAAEQSEPVVRNDSNSLPDGSGLVNLTAMPVAVQGNLRGVILMANKRSGPFTEQDTEVLLSIGKHAGVAMENHRLHSALNDAYSSTIAVLADAIEAKDPYTRGHCESVALIAVQVARRLGLQGDEVEQVRYAALLHDVGKIGIPDGILLKPSRLLPEEFQMIQRHATIGSDLVSRVTSLASIAPTILHHHERFDGTGYPDGLSGEAILLASRIVGVVDAFDAMTTPRPYRNPVSTEEALAELSRCAGAQFDPRVVEIVTEVINAGENKPAAVAGE